MTGTAENGDGRRGSRWRLVAWGGAAFLLLVPLVAMQLTEEVAWDVKDFAVFGAMLLGAGITYEVAARRTGDTAYRFAVGVALAAAFLLVWLSLGVGIIGKDGDPANLMYFGVLGVGIVGSFAARFEPRGMARALFATALAQALVGVIASIAGLGRPWSGPLEILGLTGFFVALFTTSAWWFRRAAHGRSGGDEVGGDPPAGTRSRPAGYPTP